MGTHDAAECLATKCAPRGTAHVACPVHHIHVTRGTAAKGPLVQTQDALSHKKRFFPIQGSSRGTPKIKRAHSNKQHLNSGMSRTHLSRLRRPQIVATGAVSRMLRRLLAPIV